MSWCARRPPFDLPSKTGLHEQTCEVLRAVAIGIQQPRFSRLPTPVAGAIRKNDARDLLQAEHEGPGSQRCVGPDGSALETASVVKTAAWSCWSSPATMLRSRGSAGSLFVAIKARARLGLRLSKWRRALEWRSGLPDRRSESQEHWPARCASRDLDQGASGSARLNRTARKLPTMRANPASSDREEASRLDRRRPASPSCRFGSRADRSAASASR